MCHLRLDLWLHFIKKKIIKKFIEYNFISNCTGVFRNQKNVCWTVSHMPQYLQPFVSVILERSMCYQCLVSNCASWRVIPSRFLSYQILTSYQILFPRLLPFIGTYTSLLLFLLTEFELLLMEPQSRWSCMLQLSWLQLFLYV